MAATPPPTGAYGTVTTSFWIFASITITALCIVSTPTRCHMVILSLVMNLLWRPVGGFMRIMFMLNGYRKLLGIGKKEAIFYPPIIYMSSLKIAKYLVPEDSTAYGYVLIAEDIANLLSYYWLEGIPVFSSMQVLYHHIFSSYFTSRFFWVQIFPLYLLWWAGEWIYWIYRDYNTFLDLGRGGSQPNFRGWALARWRAWFASVKVMRPPRIDPNLDPYRGRLSRIPRREGERPIITGVTPQRQVTHRARPGTTLVMERMMADIVERQFDGSAITFDEDHPRTNLIDIRLSYLERGLPALRRNLDSPHNPADIIVPIDPNDHGPLDRPASFGTRNEFGGEIFHPHRDGTSHIVLHPEDVRLVLAAGLGERHPFCARGSYWRVYWSWFLGLRLPVPDGLVILYAPRDQAELDVITTLIEAAIWNDTKGQLFPLTADSDPFRPGPNAA